MSDAQGWPLHETACRRVFDCLRKVYERDEIPILAATVAPELRETLDGLRKREEMWLSLLDAATRARLVETLMRAVQQDRRRAECHEHVAVWLAWQKERLTRFSRAVRLRRAPSRRAVPSSGLAHARIKCLFPSEVDQ